MFIQKLKMLALVSGLLGVAPHASEPLLAAEPSTGLASQPVPVLTDPSSSVAEGPPAIRVQTDRSASMAVERRPIAIFTDPSDSMAGTAIRIIRDPSASMSDRPGPGGVIGKPHPHGPECLLFFSDGPRPR